MAEIQPQPEPQERQARITNALIAVAVFGVLSWLLSAAAVWVGIDLIAGIDVSVREAFGVGFVLALFGTSASS